MTGKKVNATADATVWCSACYIRIAPYDRRFATNGKLYHDRCYAKLLRLQKQTKK